MDRFRRTNPSASRIITNKMLQRQHVVHMKKIKSVKSVINVRGLKLKRVRNYKLEQMKEDRAMVIDRQNKRLLERMEEIEMTPQMDCHLKRHAAQTNYITRQMQLDYVNEQNLKLLKRLQTAAPVYNAAKWEKEREEMEHRITWMSQYDDTGKPKGFVFGLDNSHLKKAPGSPNKSAQTQKLPPATAERKDFSQSSPALMGAHAGERERQAGASTTSLPPVGAQGRVKPGTAGHGSRRPSGRHGRPATSGSVKQAARRSRTRRQKGRKPSSRKAHNVKPVTVLSASGASSSGGAAADDGLGMSASVEQPPQAFEGAHESQQYMDEEAAEPEQHAAGQQDATGAGAGAGAGADAGAGTGTGEADLEALLSQDLPTIKLVPTTEPTATAAAASS